MAPHYSPIYESMAMVISFFTMLRRFYLESLRCLNFLKFNSGTRVASKLVSALSIPQTFHLRSKSGSEHLIRALRT